MSTKAAIGTNPPALQEEYLTQCWNCLGEFDSLAAIWCSCNPHNPSKVCPFCLTCFCSATEEFKDQFWKDAPAELQEDLSTLRHSKLPLGELLVRANLLTTSQLLEGLKKQRRRKDNPRIGEVLVELGFLSRENLEYFLNHQKKVPAFDLRRTPPSRELVEKIGLDLCRRKRILPLELEMFKDRPMLTLAMASPGDADTIDQIQSLTQAQVIPGQASEDEILRHLRLLAAEGDHTPAPEESTTAEDAMAFAQKFLSNALGRGASDAHAEVRHAEFVGRYRIDGMQYKVQAPPQKLAESVGHSLYELFEVRPKKRGAIVESRLTISAGDKKATLFLRVVSNREGEDFRIKIVDEQKYVIPLAKHGLEKTVLKSLEEALHNDNGLFVVSAPPLHGLRSLLYAIQQHVAESGKECVCLERTSLVKIPGVTQRQFGSSKAAFKTALSEVRSQLPQVLVLPALEDGTTIPAIKELAPLTLVITAVRAKSSFEALDVLQRLGLEPEFAAAHLRGILNQRLVRMLCSSCRSPQQAGNLILSSLGLSPEEAKGLKVHQAQGCDECRLQAGYHGRTPLVELLRTFPQLRARIIAGAPAKELRALAREAGMRTLRDRGLDRVRQGITSVDEFQKGNF
ncbi:MAG: ATPase, T2SS/T4P/T4SS family [Acidobacteria bacterium]|nr:ATPase, T2SS/T4P/T4SS family [Acidobacteriota bacterium]